MVNRPIARTTQTNEAVCIYSKWDSNTGPQFSKVLRFYVDTGIRYKLYAATQEFN